MTCDRLWCKPDPAKSLAGPQGTRPYNVGEGPEPAAEAAAATLGLTLPADHAARLFEPAEDIVRHDLLLVMDKFTAGDVMREVGRGRGGEQRRGRGRCGCGICTHQGTNRQGAMDANYFRRGGLVTLTRAHARACALTSKQTLGKAPSVITVR